MSRRWEIADYCIPRYVNDDPFPREVYIVFVDVSSGVMKVRMYMDKDAGRGPGHDLTVKDNLMLIERNRRLECELAEVKARLGEVTRALESSERGKHEQPDNGRNDSQ